MTTNKWVKISLFLIFQNYLFYLTYASVYKYMYICA